MFRRIEVKKQADAISAFIKNAGGSAKRTQVLELVAQLNGASTWNAFQGQPPGPEAGELSALAPLAHTEGDAALVKTLLNIAAAGSARSASKKERLEGAQKQLARIQALAKAFEHSVWQAMGFNRETSTVPEGTRVIKLTATMYDCNNEWELEGHPLDAAVMAAVCDQGIATALYVAYPRGDRYGVPDEVTPQGGKEWLWNEGFRVLNDIAIDAEDEGGDGMAHCVLTLAIPAELSALVLQGA
jgi:hypothetical protein